MRPAQRNDVFHAIAHPARRAILATLRGGECSAGDLAEPFRMTFPAISQHLRALEAAKLVSVRRQGRQRRYRLEPGPLEEVQGWIGEFAGYLERRLDALGLCLDRKDGEADEPTGLTAASAPATEAALTKDAGKPETRGI